MITPEDVCRWFGVPPEVLADACPAQWEYGPDVYRSAGGATIPAVTADHDHHEPRDEDDVCGASTPDGPCVLAPGHTTGPELERRGHMSARHVANLRRAFDGGVPAATAEPPEIDMAYLMQRAMRNMQVRGVPLPEGITDESLAEWEREHPDYDPALPLAQPMPDLPEGWHIKVGAGKHDPASPDPVPEPADWVPPSMDLATVDHVIVFDSDTGIEIGTLDAADPAERCLARTASPIDKGRRCPVHPHGAHECYRGPGHQGADRTGMPGGVVHVLADPDGFSEVRPRDPSRAPEWARHLCDCGFWWADIIQDPVPGAGRDYGRVARTGTTTGIGGQLTAGPAAAPDPGSRS